jgi:hypothetical protein
MATSKFIKENAFYPNKYDTNTCIVVSDSSLIYKLNVTGVNDIIDQGKILATTSTINICKHVAIINNSDTVILAYNNIIKTKSVHLPSLRRVRLRSIIEKIDELPDVTVIALHSYFEQMYLAHKYRFNPNEIYYHNNQIYMFNSYSMSNQPDSVVPYFSGNYNSYKYLYWYSRIHMVVSNNLRYNITVLSKDFCPNHFNKLDDEQRSAYYKNNLLAKLDNRQYVSVDNKLIITDESVTLPEEVIDLSNVSNTYNNLNDKFIKVDHTGEDKYDKTEALTIFNANIDYYPNAVKDGTLIVPNSQLWTHKTRDSVFKIIKAPGPDERRDYLINFIKEIGLNYDELMDFNLPHNTKFEFIYGSIQDFLYKPLDYNVKFLYVDMVPDNNKRDYKILNEQLQSVSYNVSIDDPLFIHYDMLAVLNKAYEVYNVGGTCINYGSKFMSNMLLEFMNNFNNNRVFSANPLYRPAIMTKPHINGPISMLSNRFTARDSFNIEEACAKRGKKLMAELITLYNEVYDDIYVDEGSVYLNHPIYLFNKTLTYSARTELEDMLYNITKFDVFVEGLIHTLGSMTLSYKSKCDNIMAIFKLYRQYYDEELRVTGQKSIKLIYNIYSDY